MSKVTVTGTFRAADGTPCGGTVMFRPCACAVDITPDPAIITTRIVGADLDDEGKFSVEVEASDDPGWRITSPMAYEVLVRVDGCKDTYHAYVNAPGPHDLADLIKLDEPPGVVLVGGVADHGALTGLADDDHPQYATKVALDGWVAAITDLALASGPDAVAGHEARLKAIVAGAADFAAFKAAVAGM